MDSIYHIHYPPVSGRDMPQPPLPDPGEGGPVYPGPEDFLPDAGQLPDIPLPDPGEGGPVKPDSGQIPVIPLPDPGEGGPVSPDPGQIPVIPLPDPGEGGPVDPGQARVRVRFLNAVTDGTPLRITLGNRLMATYLVPGHITGYFNVAPGFRPLVFSNANALWAPLYRSKLPFNPGEIITLAAVRSGGGMDLVRVDDSPTCEGRWAERGCIRLVNLAYNSPGLDLLLTDGRVVFTDVRFKEATTYRRARPGQYDMYVAQTPYSLPEGYDDIETVEELPLWGDDCTSCGMAEPLASFYLDAKAGVRSTIYLMGNWNRSRYLRTRIVDNY